MRVRPLRLGSNLPVDQSLSSKFDRRRRKGPFHSFFLPLIGIVAVLIGGHFIVGFELSKTPGGNQPFRPKPPGPSHSSHPAPSISSPPVDDAATQFDLNDTPPDAHKARSDGNRPDRLTEERPGGLSPGHTDGPLPPPDFRETAADFQVWNEMAIPAIERNIGGETPGGAAMGTENCPLKLQLEKDSIESSGTWSIIPGTDGRVFRRLRQRRRRRTANEEPVR